MIESVAISSVATFGANPESLSGLSSFNFVFGSNGTGKTTLSRIIADEAGFPACTVTWKGGTRLQSMVYNRDFVDRNFNQSEELKGVFTLGERQVDTLAKIASAKTELDTLTKRIEGLTINLQGDDGSGGKKGELVSLEGWLKEKCWAQKQRHDAKLYGAFEGYRGSSEKFKNKISKELTENAEEIISLAELEKKAESVFGTTPVSESAIVTFDSRLLIEHESNPILNKRVIGKEDVDIAAIIKKLGNSDWVREGRTFFDESNGVCPFCQQSTTSLFAHSLNEYFDESFLTDSREIEKLASNYSSDSSRFQHHITSVIATPSRFLDVEKLKLEKELLDSKIIINLQRLEAKKREPSQAVELESINNIASAIHFLIRESNTLIIEHNKMVSNLAQERKKLTAQVWRYVVEELNADCAEYKAKRDGLEKAVAGINAQLTTATNEKSKKLQEIRNLEKQTTSVQPTIDAINALLSSFGFQGFSIAKTTGGTSYKLIRANGTDAKATLSEGEKTFVTFLYFYHLLKGSDSDVGVTIDRVVVFDDPVCSLDSDILFIVGSLIKGLFDEVRAATGHIKQIFVLTHNVYFHKEITYNPKRKDVAMNEETFWIVKKPSMVSRIDHHRTNPIKTSYELLWLEVRKPERSNLAIQNTLRRILENYFKILGHIEFEVLCSMFEGRERLICKSLCSWIHDGSHHTHDDLYVSIDDSMVEKYLKVFRAVFFKSGQGAHYKMMMGDAFVEEQEESVTT